MTAKKRRSLFTFSKNQDWKQYWQTKISTVSPDTGNSVVRGYPLCDIIESNMSFAELVYLVIKGELPNEKQATMVNVLLCSIGDYGFEQLIPAIELPDADDCHVVAAAIHTRAEGIVTFNLRDFPDEALEPFNLRAIHPDEFIMDLMDLNIGAVLNAARTHRQSLKNPAMTVDAYLDCLLKQQLPQSVSRLPS